MKSKELLIITELESALRDMSNAVTTAKRIMERDGKVSSVHSTLFLNGLLNAVAVIEIQQSDKDSRIFLYDLLDRRSDAHDELLKPKKARLKSRLEKCR